MATPAFGAQAGTEAEPNNAALYDARRRQTVSGSQVIENIVAGSNCTAAPFLPDAGTRHKAMDE